MVPASPRLAFSVRCRSPTLPLKAMECEIRQSPSEGVRHVHHKTSLRVKTRQEPR
jgi:hypothetical protein